jgi:hypothetical protein
MQQNQNTARMVVIAILLTLVFGIQTTFAQLTVNNNLNTYPTDPAEPAKDIGTGKVGIGPRMIWAGGGLLLNPQDLLHIHGWQPSNTPPFNLYKNPFLRISLEEEIDPSRAYGLLGMQNLDDDNVAPLVSTTSLSAIADKYDFVLSTSKGTIPSWFWNPVLSDPLAAMKPYTADLIISSRNSKGAIRFATTPPTFWWDPVLGRKIMLNVNQNDEERMTILNNGNIGIKNNEPKGLVQIGDRMIMHDGEWSGIKYNQFFDVSDQSSSNWAEKRLFNGSTAGLSFLPNNAPLSVIGRHLQGGVSLWATRFGTATTTPSNEGMNLWLASGRLELWRDEDGVQMRVMAPIPADPDHNFPAREGWTFFRHKVLIGTEGKEDPNYKEPLPNIWTTPTGEIDLTGLNTTQPLKLAANGLVLCKELLVKTSSPIPWPDFVFDEGHELMSLDEVERYVSENKHLPGIPSAAEIDTQGVNVVDMHAKLLQKIEELTLYVIELKKENEQMSIRIDEMAK